MKIPSWSPRYPESGGKLNNHRRQPRPKCDVVSIRRHGAESGPVEAWPTTDGYRSIGLSIFAIFQVAYALPNQSGLVRENQIDGSPDWLSTELPCPASPEWRVPA